MIARLWYTSSLQCFKSGVHRYNPQVRSGPWSPVIRPLVLHLGATHHKSGWPHREGTWWHRQHPPQPIQDTHCTWSFLQLVQDPCCRWHLQVSHRSWVVDWLKQVVVQHGSGPAQWSATCNADAAQSGEGKYCILHMASTPGQYGTCAAYGTCLSWTAPHALPIPAITGTKQHAVPSPANLGHRATCCWCLRPDETDITCTGSGTGGRGSQEKGKRVSVGPIQPIVCGATWVWYLWVKWISAEKGN